MGKSFKFNFFDWFLIAGVVGMSIIMAVVNKHIDILDFIGVCTGIVNLVLCAKGNILNYAFGIIYNAIYAYTAFSTSLYADAAIYVAYYLPMQFVGWFNWKKNSNRSNGTVNVRHLSWRMAFILLAIAAVLLPLLAKILALPVIGDAQPWTDAATTAASIIAMYMMVKAIAEQWYIWLILDILQVIKWLTATISGTEHAEMWLIMFSFYTANAVYGLIQWNRIAKTENK
ncbi:MAG: nicotinamide mononucleotide transporter [Bacteroidales bacterium]|nr:nicotinamide mononucleotide transporter [Candidatus Cacconaster merdequi]